MIELEDIAFSEIEPFYNSLGDDEIRGLGIALENLLAADYVCGVKAGGHLSGIGGYLKSYRFIPSSFDVVASAHQGEGLGHQLYQKRLAFARKRYSYIVTSIGNLQTHPAAVRLCYEHGLKILYRGTFYMAFNRKGMLICRLLQIIYAAYFFVYDLPLGHSLLKSTHKLSSRRRTSS